MSNMSYCRFENTLNDLYDCSEHLRDDLNGSESDCRDQLIDLCLEVAEEFDDGR